MKLPSPPRLTGLALVVILAIMLTACGKGGEGQGGHGAGGGMPPAVVAVKEVQPATVPVEFEYPAQTAGSREAEVRARVQGLLIKRNYDEASYRQLEMEIHNLTEQRLAQTDQRSHSAYHLERGKQLASQNAPVEAEKEFREAIKFNSNQAFFELAALLFFENKLDEVDGLIKRGSEGFPRNVNGYVAISSMLIPCSNSIRKFLTSHSLQSRMASLLMHKISLHR